jgi:molybdate transport system substrate-binding protein
VLVYVERGEVAAGIVYATDAAEADGKVRVVAKADPKWHEPIVYPAAVVADTKHRAAAERFLKHLCSDDAAKVLRARGFVVPSSSDSGGKDTPAGGGAK